MAEKGDTNSGIQSFGESNDWKSIERTYNNTIHKVIDIIKVKYCNEKSSFEEKKDINILLYVNENYDIIEKDMNISLKNLYKKKDGDNTRRKRTELSISATKTVNKHNVSIVVKFD